MFPDYSASVTVAVIRTAFWFVVVFVLLPRLLFRPGRRKGGIWRRLFEYIVQMSFASVIIVQLLVVLHMFDQISLLGSYFALGLALAVLRTRTSPFVLARRLWQYFVVRSMDLLDNIDGLRARVKGVRWSQPRLLLAGARAHLAAASDIVWALLLGAVLLASAGLRLADAWRHPASDLPGYLRHLEVLKLLGLDQTPTDGAQALGTTALLQVLRRVSNVDDAMLVRVAPGLVGVLVVVAIAWGVRRLGAGPSAAILAAALYGLLQYGGWLPARSGAQGDPLAVELSLALFVPCLVFAVEAVRGSRRSRWLLAQAIGAATFVSPFTGLVALLGALAAALAQIALRRLPNDPRVCGLAVSLAVGGWLVGIVPSAVTAVRSRGSPANVTLVDIVLGRSPPGGGFFAPAAPVAYSLTAAIIGALAVILTPVPGKEASVFTMQRRGLGVMLLLFTVGAAPHRFGLPELLWAPAFAQVISPVICLVAGVALHLLALQTRLLLAKLLGGSRWRFGRLLRPRPLMRLGSAAIVLGLAVGCAAPLRVVPGPRQQDDAVVAYLYQVKDQLPPYKWTIVDAMSSLPQAKGLGFFVDRQYFLNNYDPRKWRFDPRRPDLAVPTPNVLVLVPDNLPAAEKRQVQAWMKAYAARHHDLTVEQPLPGLTVYKIYRSPEEEAKILEQIRQEEKRKRGG